MDSNVGGLLLNTSALESMFNKVKRDDGSIDLGLSLKTLHTHACHPVDQSSENNLDLDYQGALEWPYLESSVQHLKSPKCSRITSPNDCEDLEGVQSKVRWSYVKVNIDGLVVGRKICLLEHNGYSTLALQLEDMFGGLTTYGLRLFQHGSEFMLLYKDREEKWRSAGDVPWKDFVDRAKRLRIMRINNALLA